MFGVSVRNLRIILLILALVFIILETIPFLFNVNFCQKSSPAFNYFQDHFNKAASGVLLERKLLKELTGFLKREHWSLPNDTAQRSITPREMCQSTLLLGRLNVTFEAPTFEEIARRNPELRPGGQYRPKNCESEQLERIAIIIPYRNRDIQLRALINHLHPILQRQQLHYLIIVVEQAGNDTFNKALLMNIAFREALLLERNQIGCFIFHDVDLFTEDDRGIYHCVDKPLHISEYIDKFKYEPWGGTDVLFGGIVSIKRRLFELVNGYSNVFFGWGGEDEEMRRRLLLYKIPVITPDRNFYRFKMFRHGPDAGNPWNENGTRLISQTGDRMHVDGINSLQYNLLSRDILPTHTRLVVNFTREDVYKAVYGEPVENLEKFSSV